MTLRSRLAGYLARRRFAPSVYRGTIPIRSGRSMRRKKGLRAMKLSMRRIGLRKYNLHSYIRWATPDSSVINVGNQSGSSAKAFALSDTINSAELTALYDQYRIKGVQVCFQLISNPDASTSTNSGASSNHNNFFPKLWFVRDYDNVALESVDELRQRNNATCIVMNPNKMYKFYIRPAVRNQVYLDGITTATSPSWGNWLDCSNSTVPHYGCKWVLAVEGFAATQTWNMRIEYKYYLEFKNAR